VADIVDRLRHQVTIGTGQVTPLRKEAAAEIERLRTALRRYGDRDRMAWAPPELQSTIDAAMANPE